MSIPLPLADLRVAALGDGAALTAAARLLAQLGADVAAEPAAADVVLLDAPGAVGLDGAARPAAGRVLVAITPCGVDGPPEPEDAPPAGVDPLVAAMLTGAHAAVAALAALRWVRRAARGVLVEVTVREVVAGCLGDLLPRTVCPRRQGADLPRQALQVLPCADGYVGVQVTTAHDRQLLAALTGVEDVRAPDADLGTLLAPWLRARTRDAVFHAAQAWRLPVVPALSPAEAREDAQSRARGVWTCTGVRSPFRFTNLGARQPRSRPKATGGGGAAVPPLADLLVLDLGMVWAGPYCGRLLAALGARVIKVEGPHRPDGTRPARGAPCGGAFADLNRGKESLVLDLQHPGGRAAFLRLVERADVLIENFSPRVMPNFGLAYPTLAAANPRLLMLSLPAFGATGPWAHYVAYGGGLELVTGLAPRDAQGRPIPAPVAYLDYLAGTYGAAGLLAALLARDRTGRGAHLELAQREVACQVLDAAGDVPLRPWTLDPAVLAADSRLRARGLLAPPAPAGEPCHHLDRPPWCLHGVPVPRERPAPPFSAHSRVVLETLASLTLAEVAALWDAGAVVLADPASRPDEELA
jgi:crotonobetainyl-CoA:carnitine CoA-transferase CaiB-like acyl-CoA transferase